MINPNTKHPEEVKEVARTIMQQIGSQALYMLGAKEFLADWRVLYFRVGRNRNKVTKVRISLNMSDYYNVTFFNIRGMKVKEVAHVEDVACDQLRPVLEKYTGMYLSL